MKAFDIVKPDVCLLPALKEKIDNLTKPKGSLGRLEELAMRVGLVQQTLSPKLQCPQNIIFAADHGIAAEGVSLSPKAITWQQVCNFVKGGAGINFLCRQHNFKLKIVDAGVDYDFSHLPGVINMKVRRGSRNFLYEAAMTDNEFYLCIERGATIVSQCHKEGANVLSFGEMGIGNTSPSSVWMSLFTGIPLPQCIGAGSGLNAYGMRHKHDVLSRAIDNYHGNGTPLDIIRYFGGLEMAMAVGAMLQAAQLKILILVDGFIMGNCVLAASKLYPEVLDYAIFTHCSGEAGHRLLLDYLHVSPLLDLGLRLGEGTGAVCAFPLIDSAVRMINEMDSFSHAGVEKYF